MKTFNHYIHITNENARLWMGVLGFLVCLVVFVMTCVFNYNGEETHIRLTETFLFVSQGLLGLNIIKEGVNLNLHTHRTGDNRNEEHIHDHNHEYNHSDEQDNYVCSERQKNGSCPKSKV